MQTLKVDNTMDASEQYYHCPLLSIDAWRDERGWQWMRQQGWLTEHSKGRVTIDWHRDMVDGLLCEVLDKSTGDPILALSSVH